MCKEATVITRVDIDDKKIINLDNDKTRQISIDEQSKMLCHVLVRTTHELHVNQHKSRNEIQTFLKNDCQKLSTNELTRKVNKILNFHTL